MNKAKSIIINIIKNKYLLSISLFLIVILLLDSNNLIKRFQNKREMSRLRSEIEKHKEEYEEAVKKLDELESSKEGIEKIARERYYMKKDNEDIFVFE